MKSEKNMAFVAFFFLSPYSYFETAQKTF